MRCQLLYRASSDRLGLFPGYVAPGPFQDVAGWLLTAAVLMACFHFTYARKSTSSGWIATLAFAFYLFVVFKAGFVRQDGHSRIAGDSLLFAGLILLAFLRFRWAIVIAVVVVLDWSVIETNYEPLSLRLAYDRAYDALAGIPAKIAARQHKGNLDAMFEQANVSLRALYPLPNLSTTADIYPANLSSLFASGTPWSGRPIPQSYSSYTASLNALNAAHLTSPTAPDNVFFSISPIDARLPALEDSEAGRYC